MEVLAVYAPHTVTLYNVTVDPSTLAVFTNVTILEGVFLDIGKASNVAKTGLAEADSATLFIPFTVAARDGTTGAVKTYIEPKAYKNLQSKAGYWTLETGGDGSGAGCFFVKGTVVSSAGYKAIRQGNDYVFDVTTVDLRDFGSADMQHWQVGGR